MKKIILIFAVLAILTSSCRKDIIEQDEQTSTKTMVDLTIADDFNWKTTKDIQINIKGTTKGVISINSIDGATFHKGMLNADETYNTKITLPTHINEVQLIYSGITEVLPLVNNKLQHSY